MIANNNTAENPSWLDRSILPAFPRLTLEILIFAAIVALAFVSRFYDLGARVMSHDESLHTYYSWLLATGHGYQHNPMMHGPLQFHLLALIYFLFGANDATARIPAAIFGVATICMLWHWRQYLGRSGALAAAFLMLISPYMLFYARYTRNESFIGLFGVLMLYAMLRYFETGKHRYLYLLTATVVLHFTAKETSFIYAAQALLYLGIYFIVRVTRKPWQDDSYYRVFLAALFLGLLLLGAAFGSALISREATAATSAETAAPAVPATATSPLAMPPASSLTPSLIAFALGVLVLLAALVFLVRGYSMQQIRQERSFDMIVLIGTLVLPQLSALLIKAVGWNPLDYSDSGIWHTAVILIPIAVISLAIGMWWNFGVWWRSALLFYAVYVIFYTTIFTNGAGFFTGIIGSLGYWLEQQSVQRGSQPWYYYLLIQIPIYEFLPALASIVALFMSIRARTIADPGQAPQPESESRSDTLTLLGFWTATSLLAYSLAGEKMPWLTFHIALPMILWGGWAIGRLIDATDWAGLRQRRALLVTALMVVLALSLFGVLVALLLSPTPPFQGKALDQLEASGSFVLAAAVVVASGWGLYRLLKDWELAQFLRLSALILFGLLAVLTIHASARANYVDYDSAQEYLVYAHGYTGVKDVMRQVDEISQRTTGGKNLVVAFDDDVSWPFTWYLRDYPNQKFYGGEPGLDLRDVPVIIVGDNNFTKIEPIVGNAYFRFDYIRMVWPNQDYFELTWPRIRNAILDPKIRAGIFDIWLNRDYSIYAGGIQPYMLKENQYFDPTTYALDNWQPSDRMRLYVRKDVAAQIWNYGIGQAPASQVDPYAKGKISINADLVFGEAGSGDGQLNTPRGIAIAPDGSLYAADSHNNRIEHFAPDGKFINAWGTFVDGTLQAAPPGTFNEPWGVAVGPDGSVYVSDTWNHRIQKFTADGKPLKVWGQYGLAETPGSFWGPRGIAVDSHGHVYIADTGNKRIVIYDSDGNYLSAFGSEGAAPGQFSEPVDVAVDGAGNLYVTDTWNQRLQTFAPSADGLTFTPLKQWDVNGWFGQSLDNKPFLAVDAQGHVFATDPEGYRILEFNPDGGFIHTWGDYGTDPASFGLASGIAVDGQGRIWVSDANNNRLMRFTVP